MIREQTVLLKIWYDDSQSEEPAKWDWPELLGLGFHMDESEGVSVLEVDGMKIPDNQGNLVHDQNEED